MNSIDPNCEEECNLCGARQDLLDTRVPRYRHLPKKLKSIITECQHRNWLRFMCLGCRKKVDDFWEFSILCRNAYKKFLEQMENPFSVKDECEEDKKHFSASEMLFVSDGDTVNNLTDKGQRTRNPEDQSLELDDMVDDDVAEEPTAGKTGRKRVKRKQIVTCGICKKTYPKSNLKQHMRVVHYKITPYLCNVCGKSFATRYKIEQHELVHVKDRPRYPCDLCKKTFTRTENLRRHVDEVHKDSTKRQRFSNKCKYCKIRFVIKEEYFEHLKTHPGARIKMVKGKRKCGYCPMEFRTNQALEKHERVHTGEKPFTCEICAKTFRQDMHLRRHMNVHTGARKYPCEYCDKVFTQTGNLRVHVRIHTGEKPYECSTCSKRFSDQKMWKKHSFNCSETS